VQLGLSFDYEDSWFGSLRMRHFGERPLTEDGSVSSDETTIWNLRVGYQLENWTFRADVINLTDSNDRDIDYFYASRLADEPLGSATEDVHYHVMEPRTFRLSAGYRF
jgi:outer membrane receptor protein involved in Fe transport